MKETFGEYIRKLRTAKELTLTQLAAQLGIDSANLSKIETGKRELDEKKLPKLSKIFKLDFNTVKEEYYSEKIAKKIYEMDCSEHTLHLAEQKVKYLKQKNLKQTELNLK